MGLNSGFKGLNMRDGQTDTYAVQSLLTYSMGQSPSWEANQ